MGMVGQSTKRALARAAFGFGLLGLMLSLFLLLLVLVVDERLPTWLQKPLEALPNTQGTVETVALLAGASALLAIVLAKLFGATFGSDKDKDVFGPPPYYGLEIIFIIGYLVKSRDLGRTALWLGTFALGLSVLFFFLLSGNLP